MILDTQEDFTYLEKKLEVALRPSGTREMTPSERARRVFLLRERPCLLERLLIIYRRQRGRSRAGGEG